MQDKTLMIALFVVTRAVMFSHVGETALSPAPSPKLWAERMATDSARHAWRYVEGSVDKCRCSEGFKCHVDGVVAVECIGW